MIVSITPHISDKGIEEHVNELYRPVFLAGGITNCPDWQAYAISYLLENSNKLPHIRLYNPRNKEEIKNLYDQIYWETEKLKIAQDVLFWFPEQTVCPITLFELGRMLEHKDKNLYVGCSPKYPRRLDLLHQLAILRDEEITLHYSLDSLLSFYIEKNSCNT